MLVHILLKYLNMQVCVPKLHHPWSAKSSPYPSADTKIILRWSPKWGGATVSRLTKAAWWYFFVNYGQKQGEKNGARGSFSSKDISRSTMLRFLLVIISMYFLVFLLGRSICMVVGSFVYELPRVGRGDCWGQDLAKELAIARASMTGKPGSFQTLT